MKSIYNKNCEIIYCCNCGKRGHNYKKCLSPVISYGIILYDDRGEDIKYLMIQRKDTLGFVEFIRGKYSLNNYKYITQIFKIMTYKERKLILENDFDYLWNSLWMNQYINNIYNINNKNIKNNKNNKNNKNTLNEYKMSKEKFNMIKNGIYINRIFINLEIINKMTPYIYYETEWGFPKGRRNLYETDIKCAIREFNEETNISSKNYTILDYNKTFIETFYGTNNIKYRHVYYLGKLLNNIDLCIDKKNINQISEIRNIDWFNFNDAYNIIRPYNNEKKKVIKYINSYLLSQK